MALPEVGLLRAESSSEGRAPNSFDSTLSDLKRLLVATPAEMRANTLFVLESTLRRLGTSGISQRLANLVQVFLSGEIRRETAKPW
jgi:hypothetical protein